MEKYLLVLNYHMFFYSARPSVLKPCVHSSHPKKRWLAFVKLTRTITGGAGGA